MTADGDCVEEGAGPGAALLGETLPSAEFTHRNTGSSSATRGDVHHSQMKVAKPSDLFTASLSCCMYVACSTVMVLSNKWLSSTTDVKAYVSMLLMQNTVATLTVSLFNGLGAVSYKPFDRRIAVRWLPVNVFFVVMLLTSFMAMRYISVPMITVFKQLANLLTVCGESYFFSKTITRGVLVSFFVMISGAVLAARNDVAFSLPGYVWQGANCVATSGYVLYLKHATKTVQLPKFGMVFYNNLLSLPLLALIAIGAGEPRVLYEAHLRGALDGRFFAFNAFAGVVGFLLNIASVWCVSATSATTYAVVGALNKVPVTVLGVLIFHTKVSSEMATYIAISLCGGFLYSYEQLRVRRK